MSEYLPCSEIKYANNGRQYEAIDLVSLADIGFADGWADLESDEVNISKEIDRRPIERFLKEYYRWMYEEGYTTGLFMSENASEIYDDDGELKDDYDL